MTETNNLKLNKFEATDNFDYTKLNENADTIDRVVSNPNLLMNTDFSNPVNQRGYASGSEISMNYSIDRWLGGISSLTLVNNSHIRINLVSGRANNYFVQRMENYKSFSNKTITVSAKYRTNSNKAYLTAYHETESTSLAFYGHKMIADSEWHIGSFTVTFPNISSSTSGKVEVAVYPYHEPSAMNEWTSFHATTAESCFVDIAWIKAEEGDKATSWQKPDYATELLKCQMYYQKFITSYVNLVRNSNTHSWFLYYFNKMRVAPSVVFKLPSTNLWSQDGNTYYSTAYAVSSVQDHGLMLDITHGSAPTSSSLLIANYTLELSADL